MDFEASVETPVSAEATAAPLNVNDASETSNEVEQSSSDNTDADLMAVWAKHNPGRTPDGKFAKIEGEPETPETPAPETAATESADQPAETGTEQAKPAIDAPISWSAEAKAIFATLPSPAQEIIATREKESHSAITRLGSQVKAFEPLTNILEQYKDTFQRNNLQPHDGVQRLLAFENWLAKDPNAAIAGLIQQYAPKLDPSRFSPQQPAPVAEEGTLAFTLQKRLEQAERALSQVNQHLTEQQRRDVEAQQAKVTEENAALSRQLVDFGKAHPHFEAVHLYMAGLMQAGVAETLDQAYEQAIYANPEVRSRIQEDQRKADEAKRRDELVKKSTEAKKSSQVNVRSSPGGASPKTWDDTLQEIAGRHFG